MKNYVTALILLTLTGTVTQVKDGHVGIRMDPPKKAAPSGEREVKAGDRVRVEPSPRQQQPGQAAPEAPSGEKKRILLDDRAFYDARWSAVRESGSFA